MIVVVLMVFLIVFARDLCIVMLEMMIDIDKMRVLLDAALETGLPVWVGFTCKINDAGVVCLRNGEPLGDALSVGLPPFSLTLLEIPE